LDVLAVGREHREDQFFGTDGRAVGSGGDARDHYVCPADINSDAQHLIHHTSLQSAGPLSALTAIA